MKGPYSWKKTANLVDVRQSTHPARTRLGRPAFPDRDLVLADGDPSTRNMASLPPNFVLTRAPTSLCRALA